MSDLTQRDRLLALTGILLALFLGALDQTIVATALPRIVADLQGVTRYAWVATAYLLASTAMVPIYGKLADGHSKKRIELVAVVLFLAGSFLCGLAGEFGSLPVIGDGMNQLIVFRGIQGLGGAGLFAMAFIVIADLFPPRERGKYQGFVGATFGVASVLGPIVGGFLTDHGGGILPGVAGWRWVFYVNVPFGALALWFIARRMPALPPRAPGNRMDVLGAALLLVALIPLVLGLQLDKQVHPWTAPETLGLFAVAAVGIGLFVWRALRSKNPVLDLRLFQNRVFSTSNAALFVLGGTFLSLVVFLPLFLVNVVGVSATRAGVSLIPLSLGVVAGSTLTGQLVSRFGHYKRFMLGGGAILIVGIALLTGMTAQTSAGTITLYMIVCGLGLGPALPLYPLAIQNAVTQDKVGQATSASQFFRQIGGAVSTAIAGTILAVSLVAAMPQQASAPSAEGGERMEAGPEAVEARIRARFDAAYADVTGALERGDDAAAAATAQRLPLSDSARTAFERALAAPAAERATTLRTLFDASARRAAAAMTEQVRAAFAHAIGRIYLFVLVLAVLGWLLTLLVPELPLRTTLDHGPRADDAVPPTYGNGATAAADEAAVPSRSA